MEPRVCTVPEESGTLEMHLLLSWCVFFSIFFCENALWGSYEMERHKQSIIIIIIKVHTCPYILVITHTHTPTHTHTQPTDL